MGKRRPIAQEAYDEIADEYADRVGEWPMNAGLERPTMTSLLPELEGMTVLDAGCGAGTYTQRFVSECANVIALDANKEMLRNARTRAETDAHFLQADLGEPLPFPNSFQVDLVFSSLVFHYINDWHALFEEIHDLLREDGYFVYSVQHPFSDFYSYNNSGNYFETESVVRSWDEFERSVRVPIYRRPLEEVIDSLLSTGFELERIVEPRPTEEFWSLVSSAEHDLPEVYQDVGTEPAFLCVRARAK